MIDVILFNERGKVMQERAPTAESAVSVAKRLYDDYRDRGMTKLTVGFFVDGKLVRLVDSRTGLTR